jgi:hypothetical protein
MFQEIENLRIKLCLRVRTGLEGKGNMWPRDVCRSVISESLNWFKLLESSTALLSSLVGVIHGLWYPMRAAISMRARIFMVSSGLQHTRNSVAN